MRQQYSEKLNFNKILGAVNALSESQKEEKRKLMLLKIQKNFLD